MHLPQFKMYSEFEFNMEMAPQVYYIISTLSDIEMDALNLVYLMYTN